MHPEGFEQFADRFAFLDQRAPVTLRLGENQPIAQQLKCLLPVPQSLWASAMSRQIVNHFRPRPFALALSSQPASKVSASAGRPVRTNILA